jgi:hypothetical protein
MTPEQYDQPFKERSELLSEFNRLISQELPEKYTKIFPYQKRVNHHRQRRRWFTFKCSWLGEDYRGIPIAIGMRVPYDTL